MSLISVFILSISIFPNVEAKTMSDPLIEMPLSAKELRGANYAATQTLRGGETIYKGKQLGAYLLLARSVFESAIEGAARSESEEDRNAYLLAAKMTAFNIASFTWPGWNEGEIEEKDREVGFQFSRVHMNITEQLDLPPEKRARALWIGAAHELAAKNYAAARSLFTQAKVLGEENNSKETALMNQGWMLVIDILQGDIEAGSELKKLQERITKLGEDGKFYAGQYDDALKVFDK